MARAFIILLDSLGIGSTADAGVDSGADTLRHVAEYLLLPESNDNIPGRALHLPNLTKLGLNAAATLSGGLAIPGLATTVAITGAYGCAAPLSYGQDTISGHWELAGVPVFKRWQHYTSFPPELLDSLITRASLPGILGNKAASGTAIINEFGLLHQNTAKPIIYTSADSVLQSAAHESSFGLEKLYAVCEVAREIANTYNIARVIARPFVGDQGAYVRTGGRRDYALAPPAPTLLDHIVAAGKQVIAIGKIADIYAHRGISTSITAYGNQELFASFVKAAATSQANSLVFVNLVDFDTLYGHRRDIKGYALALEQFDQLLPQFTALLQPDDLAIITADHGCDPSWHGSDHTREYVPILAFGPKIRSQSLGKRSTFADIGQTIAHHLAVAPLLYGQNFL
jgi:phosphopentomutase